MRKHYLRFADLVERGVVRNRVTLSNWIKKHDFPRGQLIGPNTRVWTEGEVEAWIAKGPSGPKPNTPVSKGQSAASAASLPCAGAPARRHVSFVATWPE
jgi:predicted DNA-binding transcriptional regulator AlpA